MNSTLVIIVASVSAAVLIFLFRSKVSEFLIALLRPEKIGRIYYEDALKHLYKMEESNLDSTVQSVAGQLEVSIDRATSILNGLVQKGLASILGETYGLTPDGRDYAIHIIRAHRLWERYLADQTGISETEWHSRADRQEHELTPEQADDLSAQLGNPTYDPHGDPVPTAKGKLRVLEGQSLLAMSPGEHGRISHLEDEPPSIFARLVGEGLYPGMEFTVVSRTNGTIRIQTEGDLKVLERQMAANVTVKPVSAELLDLQNIRRLSDLDPGETAEIARVSKAARGLERRRLMDLGILPGAEIVAEMKGPGGDPTAYRIRGALIALRKEQADRIFVYEENRSTA